MILFVASKTNQKQLIFSADKLTSLCPQKLIIKGIIRQSNKIQEQQKNPNEWRSFTCEGRRFDNNISIPFVYLKRSPDKYLLICHGAAYELEYCFKEYEQIADMFGVSVISVEYPGFGGRQKEKLNSESLLARYPEEVKYCIESHLKIDWRQVKVLGQCLGAPIALRLVAQPGISERVPCLYLTKPWSSLHNTMISLLPRGLHECITTVLPDLFFTDKSITSQIKCPVKCVQGTNDKICTINNTFSLLKRITHSPTREIYFLDKKGHTVLMLEMLQHMETFFPHLVI